MFIEPRDMGLGELLPHSEPVCAIVEANGVKHGGLSPRFPAEVQITSLRVKRLLARQVIGGGAALGCKFLQPISAARVARKKSAPLPPALGSPYSRLRPPRPVGQVGDLDHRRAEDLVTQPLLHGPDVVRILQPTAWQDPRVLPCQRYR